jgi:hypothetical protein
LFSQDGNIIAYVRQTRPSIDDEIFGEETYKLSLYNTSMELIHESQLQLAGKNGAYADLRYIPQIDCFGNLIYSIGNTLYSFDKNFDIRWQINEPGQVFLRTDSLILIKKVQEIVCIDLDGSIVWKKELTELPYQFRGALLVDKNNYFVCLFDSMFGNNTHAVCFSPKGEIVWKSLLNKKTYGEAAAAYQGAGALDREDFENGNMDIASYAHTKMYESGQVAGYQALQTEITTDILTLEILTHTPIITNSTTEITLDEKTHKTDKQIAKENKAVEKRIKKAVKEENKKEKKLEKAEAKAAKAAAKAEKKQKK